MDSPRTVSEKGNVTWKERDEMQTKVRAHGKRSWLDGTHVSVVDSFRSLSYGTENPPRQKFALSNIGQSEDINGRQIRQLIISSTGQMFDANYSKYVATRRPLGCQNLRCEGDRGVCGRMTSVSNSWQPWRFDDVRTKRLTLPYVMKIVSITSSRMNLRSDFLCAQKTHSQICLPTTAESIDLAINIGLHVKRTK